MRIKAIHLTAIFSILIFVTSYGQKGYKDPELPIVKLRIDSLEKRIVVLQTALSRSKNDLAKYHRIKDEIALTNFRLTYENHYINETLELAKTLVDKKISLAYKNNRQDHIKIYEEYKKDIARRIKNQRIKYQALFKKEKAFAQYIQPYFDLNTEESLQQAVFICKLAIKFAKEQRFVTAEEFITKYKNMGEAYIYDLKTKNDLASLTKSESKFLKVYKPLFETDSISNLKQARAIIEECSFYAEKKETKLPPDYFAYQLKMVNSKLLEKEQELAILGKTGGNLVTKFTQPMDKVNDFGIFRFYDKIVVIGKINPKEDKLDAINANDIRVMKGMAIINADIMLTTYIRKNVQAIKPRSKIIYAYFIPYLIDGNYQWFIRANKKGEQQYRIAYTFVHSEKLTNTLLNEYLKPITFEKEENEDLSLKD